MHQGMQTIISHSHRRRGAGPDACGSGLPDLRHAPDRRARFLPGL